MRADTGRVQGEFIEVEPWDLRPYDLLGEGQVIRVIHYPYGGGKAPIWLEVGPCHAEVEVIDLADGPACHWRPVWGETHTDPAPRIAIRVFRGDLPGYFCEADPGTPMNPCTSDRCPARTDGKEEAGSRFDAQSLEGGRRGEPASGELLPIAQPPEHGRSTGTAVGGQTAQFDGNADV